MFNTSFMPLIVYVWHITHQLFHCVVLLIERCVADYPLSYGVPVRERYGSTLLPATREQHDQNCTQSH